MPSRKSTLSTPGVLSVLVIEATKFQRRSLCRLIRAAGADHVSEALDVLDAHRVLSRSRASRWILVADPDLMDDSAMASIKSLADRFPVETTLLLTHRKNALEELRERARAIDLPAARAMRKPVSAEEMGGLLRQLAASAGNGVARPYELTREELSECLRSGAMRARFQPRMDLGTGRPVCCEAMPCVNHPVHGVIPAHRFSQAVTQLGAQRVLTASVLRDAAEFVRQLRDRGVEIPVAVGLSPEVLCESNDAASLDAYVRTLGVAAGDLVLEITTGADTMGDAAVAENLARLKLRGYRLALREDAPIVALGEPVHAHFSEIKLRPEARSAQPGDLADEHVIGELLASARKLGMVITAVGLAANIDLDELRRAGFDYGQGELFATAMGPEEALAWIARAKGAASAQVQRHLAG